MSVRVRVLPDRCESSLACCLLSAVFEESKQDLGRLHRARREDTVASRLGRTFSGWDMGGAVGVDHVASLGPCRVQLHLKLDTFALC